MSDWPDGETHTLHPSVMPAVNIEDRRALEAQRRDEQDKRSRAVAADELVAQLMAVQSGRAGYREEGIEMWAYCGNIRGGCSDEQEPVTGVRITHARTYRDGGDDGAGADRLENSWHDYEFADPADENCARCGARRHIGEQKRPVHEARSGFDQRGLLAIAKREIENGKAGVVVQGAQPAALSPLDTLGHRLADGSITIDEFRERRAVLVELAPEPTALGAPEPESPELPEGVRARGAGFQAYKRVDGRQVQRTFETVEEAVEWREATS